MKFTIMYLLFLGSALQNISNCSTSVTSKEQLMQDEYDRIEVSDIDLNGHQLGIGKDTLVMDFGKPDSMADMLNEFDNSTFHVFYYGTSELHIVEGKFESFVVTDNKFQLSKLGISVGDNAVNLEKKFPKSFMEDVNLNEPRKLVRVLIDNTDSFLIFTYEKGKIVQFEKWTNY